MKIVILCGGMGMRLREETEYRPKPLVQIGSRPILWHIMKNYAHHGHKDFVLALGYRGWMIKEYFLNYDAMNNDFTVRLGDMPSVKYLDSHGEQDYLVTLSETGLMTNTGGRLKRLARHLDGNTFMMTYGDGLADVDMHALLAYHKKHGKLATVTGVRVKSRYGILALGNGGEVDHFAEKPQLGDWSSAGFFVLERKVLDYIDHDESIFEEAPLQRLVAEGQLAAYQHTGSFHTMDTYREYVALNEMWERGEAPWKVWAVSAGSAFWKQRPVLVTGATGLLGSWLVGRLVAQGADVVCLVRDWVPQSELYRQGLDKRTRSVTGDVRDTALLERVLAEYEIKTVMHLAAQTIVGVAVRSPVTTFESNVGGTWSLLEACRTVGRVEQIVVASSDKAYGVQPKLPYTEDSPLQGRFPYDASKSAADLIAQSYAATFGLPVGITRCGNFFGGGDLNWNRIVPGTIRSVLQNERPIIRSNGKFVRDYIFVEDGAAAYMTLAEKMAERGDLAGQGFNFSNESPIDVLGLVAKILGLMGSKLEPVIQNQGSNEIPEQFLSAQKARRELGWTPLFTLEQGLERAIEWYTRYLREAA